MGHPNAGLLYFVPNANICKDLISYKVYNTNPMELRECVEGQGEYSQELKHSNKMLKREP